MIMDERLEFADAVSVVGSAGTALIGDVIDLGPAGRDIGNGEEMFLAITVDTEIATASAAGTIAFSLVSDAQAAIAVDGSATVHFSTGAITTGATTTQARLAAGKTLVMAALPSGNYERYLGILATVGTTATTTGKINAFLTKDKAGWKAYPEGSN